MSRAQNERDKTAIRTVLRQMGATTYQDIALRAGEGLASALMEMVQVGEVVKTPQDGGQSIFHLKQQID